MTGKIGGHMPIMVDALKAAELLGLVDELEPGREACGHGNWSRHAPPPAAGRLRPVSGGLQAAALEVLLEGKAQASINFEKGVTTPLRRDAPTYIPQCDVDADAVLEALAERSGEGQFMKSEEMDEKMRDDFGIQRGSQVATEVEEDTSVQEGEGKLDGSDTDKFYEIESVDEEFASVASAATVSEGAEEVNLDGDVPIDDAQEQGLEADSEVLAFAEEEATTACTASEPLPPIGAAATAYLEEFLRRSSTESRRRCARRSSWRRSSWRSSAPLARRLWLSRPRAPRRRTWMAASPSTTRWSTSSWGSRGA